jgi:hypothetical protein
MNSPYLAPLLLFIRVTYFTSVATVAPTTHAFTSVTALLTTTEKKFLRTKIHRTTFRAVLKFMHVDRRTDGHSAVGIHMTLAICICLNKELIS